MSHIARNYKYGTADCKVVLLPDGILEATNETNKVARFRQDPHLENLIVLITGQGSAWGVTSFAGIANNGGIYWSNNTSWH